MGAWGSKIFEDDTTSDWLWDFRDNGSPFSMLQDAFHAVLQNEDYIEYQEGAAVFAAAEIVAAALGRPSDDYQERATAEDEPRIDIENLRKSISPEIIKMTIKAVVKANDPEISELAALWAESEDEERSHIVQDLLQRLSPA